MSIKSFKTFAVADGCYYINGKRMSEASFNKRRLTECFHQWRPIGCSDTDGFCRDCQLMVVKGKRL